MMWVMLTVSLTLALAVLFVQRDRQAGDGLRDWGWGLLAHAAVYPAFALRYVGYPLLSVLSANLLLALSLSLQSLAVNRFQQGRAPALPALLVWGPAGAALAGAALLADAASLRGSVLSLLLAVQAAFLAWQARAPGLEGARERGRDLLLAGSLLMVGVDLLRGIAFAVEEGGPAAFLMPSQLLTATYVLWAAVLPLNTMGFVLMQKERAEHLQHEQALHDPLTGIANRRALDEALAREASRAARGRQPLAVLMIDIDWFKKVNDSFGHQAGDAVLRALAARLQARLRRQDLLARFGGEEFVAVLPDTGPDGARVVAEGLRGAVAEAPFVVAGLSIAITVSIGVAAGIPGHVDAQGERGSGADGGLPETVAALLVASDQALYRAKEEGRDRVCVAAS